MVKALGVVCAVILVGITSYIAVAVTLMQHQLAQQKSELNIMQTQFRLLEPQHTVNLPSENQSVGGFYCVHIVSVSAQISDPDHGSYAVNSQSNLTYQGG